MEFVSQQHDEELWEYLISRVLDAGPGQDPALIGDLLEHLAGHVDPMRILGRIPAGVDIPHLQRRLVRIIADFRAQVLLREGCTSILRSDCAALQERLFRATQRAFRSVYLGPPTTTTAAPAAPAEQGLPVQPSWTRVSGLGRQEEVQASEVPRDRGIRFL